LDFATIFRVVADSLAWPTHVLLLSAAAVTLFDSGLFATEYFGRGLPSRHDALLAIGRSRIGRADMLARVGPMLGLMGTLIPLGPGLAALGNGDVAELAAAVTVAFDTTVIGLAVGALGFCLGRARRRLYDRRLDALPGEAPRG